MTYLVIVPVSSKICSSFKVDEFRVDDNEMRYYVSVDYGIEASGVDSPCKFGGSGCDYGGGTYFYLWFYASLMFLVYVVGESLANEVRCESSRPALAPH